MPIARLSGTMSAMSTDAPERPARARPPQLRAAVAEEVRALLARRRMSAIELSRRIGKSHTYVGRRLSAETAFDTDDLEQIASVLNVSVIDLLGPRLGDASRVSSHNTVYPSNAADHGQDARRAVNSHNTDYPGNAADQGSSHNTYYPGNVATRPSDRRPAARPDAHRPPPGPGRTSPLRRPTSA